MKTLIIALALSFATLPATASTYRCSVETIQDYAVEVNLLSSKAALFDNNEWSVITLADSAMGTSEALYEFSGRDADGSPLRIVFDSSEFGGGSSLSFNAGSDLQITTDIVCTYTPASDLASGI